MTGTRNSSKPTSELGQNLGTGGLDVTLEGKKVYEKDKEVG